MLPVSWIQREEDKSEVSLESETTLDRQNYYKGRKVIIIDQGEGLYSEEETYTIRLESGKDIVVLKSEVTLTK